MPESPFVTRFAPSPTGELHLGNARTALFNALLAWRGGGRFLLRIEDTDSARSQPEHARQLMQDLVWLGLAWHGEPLRQSQRGHIYDAQLTRLAEYGLTYPCFCSPRELELSRAAQLSAGRPPRYAGTCRRMPAAEARARLAAGETAALRFAVAGQGEISFDDLVHGPRRFALAEIGDFVLRRADGSAAFFFSNAVDDALSGVTHLLRGDDHLSNTPRQLLILQALGLPAPRYGHLALLTGSDGAPLSKRHGAASLRQLREMGYLPGAIANHLFRLGHSSSRQGALTLPEMAVAFDIGHLQRAPAHFDLVQLQGWQKDAVHALTTDAACAWLGARLPTSLTSAQSAAFLAAVLPNLVYPDDVLPWLEVAFGADPVPDADSLAVIEATGRQLFQAAAKAAAGNDFTAIVQAVKAATGLKGPALFKPLRAALTGRLAGPELGPLLKSMPAGSAQRRLARFA
ncbi:MAG: glutamate--tRNA ligase [Steroidobacteraceae bacterium]